MKYIKLTKYLVLLLCNFLIFGATAADIKSSSVIVINPIEIPKGKEKEALAIWDRYAEYFKKQPGFIDTKLHRSIGSKAKFHLINVAEWRSGEDFLRALNSEEIKNIGNGFPKDMPHYPSMYEVIRK